MKIVFYTGYHHCPWNGETDSLGGSETAVINIAKRMAKAGHEVSVVGETVVRSLIDGVYYMSTEDFHESRKTSMTPIDVLIGVNYIHFMLEVGYVNAKQNIFWAHNPEHFPFYKGEVLEDNGDWIYDEYDISTVVCVSQWQADVMSDKYPSIAPKIRVIGNGINTASEYPEDDIKITKNRFIYTSAADRGLDEVLELWPAIKSKYTDAELVVCTPSYAMGDFSERVRLMELLGVTIKGNLSKKELYREMVASDFWLYPTKYDETFCITALEMMYGSCIPITTDSANMKYIVPPERGFITPCDLEGQEFLQHVMDNVDKAVNMTEEEKYELREKNWDFAQDETWYERAKDWLKMVEPKKVTDLVERIFIISLDPGNAEKKQRWEEQLEAAGLGHIPCELVQAIDGTTVNENYLKAREIKLFPWKIESENDWWNRDMKPGEKGCALSHFGVWKLIHERGYEGALILEEDFVAVDKFTDSVASSVPANWDMLYLGRNALREDKAVVDENIVVPDASYNLHSYMLSKHGVKKLMDQNFLNKLMPVDEFIIATYTEHDRDDMGRVWNDSITYAVSKDVFIQESNAKTSTTENIHLMKHDESPAEVDVPVYETTHVSYETTPAPQGHLHPDLYCYYDNPEYWRKRFLSPGLTSKEWALLYDEPIDGVVCLPFFTDEFCDMIAEEAEHSDQWTVDRHDFYPTTDILLEKIGFNDIFNDLLREFVMPLAIHHFELEGKGWDEMESENFLARYVPEAQGHLSIHHDASDLTALVNLTQPDVDFTGGGTWFSRQKKLYRPPKGSLSVHPGNITHKHGARAVTDRKSVV